MNIIFGMCMAWNVVCSFIALPDGRYVMIRADNTFDRKEASLITIHSPAGKDKQFEVTNCGRVRWRGGAYYSRDGYVISCNGEIVFDGRVKRSQQHDPR